MSESLPNSPTLRLLSIAGPRSIQHPLTPPGPITIGRRSSNVITLNDEQRVSREHCMLVTMPGDETDEQPQWVIADLGSRHGTRLNGIQLEPDKQYPLALGDLIEVAPWVFQVDDPGSQVDDPNRVQTLAGESSPSSVIRRISAEQRTGYISRRLDALLASAQILSDVSDEQQMAESLVAAAVEGTGYPNVALLTPLSEDGSIRVVAHRGEVVSEQGGTRLSRSLIQQASEGEPVRLMVSEGQTDVSKSIADLQIDAALCVPIMLSDAAARFLYLDHRTEGESRGRVASDAVAFATGLASLASIALSRLQQRQIADRLQQFEQDIKRAGEAQKFVLPQRQTVVGAHEVVGHNKPGRFLSGDFFDVIPIDDHRVAVTLGDVAGKGAPAAVLMTTAHGFLHASLKQDADVLRAVNELAAFVVARFRSTVFLTLWAGVFDAREGVVRYVDAGHGYAVKHADDGQITQLKEGGGAPVGIAPGLTFQSAEVDWQVGDRVILVSDGVIEQPGPPVDGKPGEQFQMDRLRQTLQSVANGGDEVQAVFDAVIEHAQSSMLADDVTVVRVSRRN